MSHASDLFISPTSFVLKVYSDYIYDSNPNYRMQKLLNESIDLQEARAAMHRFWMNNQPAVITYERLNGKIGP